MFGRNRLPPYSLCTFLYHEEWVVDPSETLVVIYHITWHHIREGSILNTVYGPKDDLRKRRNKCAGAKVLGEWFAATTHSENIRTVHSLPTRYSKCVMFSVCAEESVAPTNSSPVVPPIVSSLPHSASHALSPPPPRGGHFVAVESLFAI
jgi:hypothetical protein